MATSSNSTPYYAVLRTKVQRATALFEVSAHNHRTIPVLFADPHRHDGVRVRRLTGSGAFNAVTSRIKESGAKWPGRGQVYAAEVLLALSEGNEQEPNREEFYNCSAAFLDRTFGHKNVVAIWEHYDEKSPHIHALVAPICYGTLPGCPTGDDEPAEGWVASWNQFCGANEVNYRDPEKARQKELKQGPKRPHRRRNLAKPAKPYNRKNQRMADWQTEWAAVWSDRGYRRGVPSTKEHMPIKWIHGNLVGLAARKAQAEEAIIKTIEGFKLTTWELFILRHGSEGNVLSEAITKRLLPVIQEHLQLLVNLAARGIQLTSEKAARAALGDEVAALKAELANPFRVAVIPKEGLDHKSADTGTAADADGHKQSDIVPSFHLRPLPMPQVKPQEREPGSVV